MHLGIVQTSLLSANSVATRLCSCKYGTILTAPSFDSALDFRCFSVFQVVALQGLMVWVEAFICELAHKEKHADTASETKSQPEKRGFGGFLLLTQEFTDEPTRK